MKCTHFHELAIISKAVIDEPTLLDSIRFRALEGQIDRFTRALLVVEPSDFYIFTHISTCRYVL